MAARFDAASGQFALIGKVMDNPRPTWAVRHPALPLIYINEDVRDNPGKVHALRIDHQTGSLAPLSTVGSGGNGNTHMTIDRAGRTLLCANFTSGSLTTIKLGRDGRPGAVVSAVQFAGSGPHRRQQSPHAHGVYLDRAEKFALVCDLGADRVWCVPFERRSGRLGAFVAAAPTHAIAAPGSGPRHAAWHPNGRVFYVVNELTATVMTLGWNPAAPGLIKLQELSTDDPAFSGNRSAAEIVVSPDGRFVYVSNRGDHAIAVYAVDRVNGTLAAVQRVPAGGAAPWHILLDRSARWLLVANRDANAIVALRRDRATGMLSVSGQSLPVPQPMHICMA